MSDTPIAEQVAADLGMPWVLCGHMTGRLDDTSRWFEDSGSVGAGSGVGIADCEDAASRGSAGAASTQLDWKGSGVADPNCGTCGGSGQVDKTEMGESGLIRRGKASCPDCG